jgi:hypothetical protein
MKSPIHDINAGFIGTVTEQDGEFPSKPCLKTPEGI